MGMTEDEQQSQKQPLVSVVLPTYGRNEFLREAIDSVLSQTYENIELFVVDDGSPTPVTERLPEIPTNRLTFVTFVRHNENRGANVARNTGIRAASGKYIAFLDDDDWWAEEKIERQVESLETTGPEYGFVYTGKHTESYDGETVTRPTTEGDVLEELLAGKSFGQFSSVMIEAALIEKAGLPDERFPCWQDREWFLRLAQHTKFKSIPETLTYRRVGHTDRITRQFEKRRDIAYPLFVEKHYPLAREHGLFLARTFLASLRMNLGRSAIRAGKYTEARKYFLLAFLANPAYGSICIHLLASLGGKRTYEGAATVRKHANKLKSLIRRVQ